VLRDGYLAFLGNTTVGTPGTTKPFDEALGSDGNVLYVLDGALGQIDALRTGAHAHRRVRLAERFSDLPSDRRSGRIALWRPETS
jgi:hypothetical protein